MDSTPPFSKQNVNIQSVKHNSCFWTNGKMGITFSSSLRSFCPTAVRAIDNGNQKINFSGISSSPPEAPKLLEVLEDFFSSHRRYFSVLREDCLFQRGFFWRGGAVRFATPPCQSRSLHSRLRVFYVTVFTEGWCRLKLMIYASSQVKMKKYSRGGRERVLQRMIHLTRNRQDRLALGGRCQLLIGHKTN